VESQLTISPPNRSASDSPRALLPHAVGPRSATTSGRSAGATSAEHVDEDVDDKPREQDDEPQLLRPGWHLETSTASRRQPTIVSRIGHSFQRVTMPTGGP